MAYPLLMGPSWETATTAASTPGHLLPPSALFQWNTTSPNGTGLQGNDTPPQHAADKDLKTYSIAEVIIIALVAGLLSLTTVVGNVMVMISFKMDKQLQTISNYFLLSLAIADFSIGLISMPLFTMYTLIEHWPLGALLCDTWLAFDYLNSNASVLNLLIISFDRYFSVTRPLTYRARRTTKRAACMIASAWLISLVLWPPWIYSWPYIEGRRTVEQDECYIQFLETNLYVTFGTALAAFYVPVTVMCILYWRIWRETEKRQKDLTHLQAGNKEGSRKSTSSDDPAPDDETQTGRTRSDSCIQQVSSSNVAIVTASTNASAPQTQQDPAETTYVSLCVMEPPAKRSRQRKKKLWDRMLTWCKIDRDLDAIDEDSTSHGGSPGLATPASVETPIQSSSRTTSMNFRTDAQILRRVGASAVTAVDSIPMTDRNGPRSRAETAAAIAAKNLSQQHAPTTRSYSTDSVYTILIRLPTQPSLDGDGGGESQASIKMIMEEENGSEAETSMQSGRGSDSLSNLPGYRPNTAGNSSSDSPVVVASAVTVTETRHGSLRTSESALETIRLPLNTKLVPKQIVAKQRVPKKKRKQQERKQEKKAAKTLSAILLAFIITWTPYNVLVLIKTLLNCQDGDDCIPAGLWNFSYYLCYINSTVNPLCYALCNANFRRTYIRILSCKWHNKNRNVVNRGYFS